MGIKKFFTIEVSVARLTAVASSNKRTFSTVDSSVFCHFQQGVGSQTQMNGSSFYKEYTAWCATGEDIQVGDKITRIDDSSVYTVQGVKTVNFDVGSNNAHLEVSLFKGE